MKTKELFIKIITLFSILFIIAGCGHKTGSFSTAQETDYITQGTVETTVEESSVISYSWEPEDTDTLAKGSSFEIFFLDVGQGDAACVLCDGKAMLIDGGNKSSSSMIYSFLKSHEVNHLDYIIASHPDADHVGGLAGALNYASVGMAFCTIEEYNSEPFSDFVKYLKKQECEITVPSSGDTFTLGGAVVTILYPDKGVEPSDNTSIALRIEYGQTSFFFAGDCESADEAVILRSEYGLKSDVLKVAHHGSRYSSSSEFVNAIQPKYAVISVGGDNQYGHPTEEVLSYLQNNNITLFRTDIQGTIHCRSNGYEILFDVEKNPNFDTYLASGGYQNYLKMLGDQNTETMPDRTLPEASDAEETSQSEFYIVNTHTHKFHYYQKRSTDVGYTLVARIDDVGFEPIKNILEHEMTNKIPYGRNCDREQANSNLP